jgi:aryl-alcohol dehydrogenase-like predicted oxidoreductase
MEKRILGSGGLEVSALGFGCMGMSQSFGPNPGDRGFLTGRIDQSTEFGAGDVRAILPRFTAEARAANQAVVDLLASVAADKGATSAQVALAWMVDR